LVCWAVQTATVEEVGTEREPTKKGITFPVVVDQGRPYRTKRAGGHQKNLKPEGTCREKEKKEGRPVLANSRGNGKKARLFWRRRL